MKDDAMSSSVRIQNGSFPALPGGKRASAPAAAPKKARVSASRAVK
jgi:hypothetical protein